jgi:hypothetical protein
VGHQHSPDVGQSPQRLGNGREISGVSPLSFHSGYVQAKELGNMRQPVAEDPDGHGKNLIAGREAIDNRRFYSPGSGRREPQNGLGSLEEILKLSGYTLEERGKLRSSMIDNWTRNS